MQKPFDVRPYERQIEELIRQHPEHTADQRAAMVAQIMPAANREMRQARRDTRIKLRKHLADKAGIPESQLERAIGVLGKSPQTWEKIVSGQLTTYQAKVLLSDKDVLHRPLTQRLDELRELAARSLGVSEIAKLMGVTEPNVRAVCHKNGIQTADMRMHKNRRTVPRIKTVKAIREAVYGISGFAMAVSDLDGSVVETSEAKDLARSLDDSFDTLKKLRRQLVRVRHVTTNTED